MRRKTYPSFKYLSKICATGVYPILGWEVYIGGTTAALRPSHFPFSSFINEWYKALIQDTEFYVVVGWQRHLSKISGEEEGGTYFISQLMTNLKERDNENVVLNV